MVLIEDTRELQCAAANLVALRTKDGVASLSELVKSSLRLRPDVFTGRSGVDIHDAAIVRFTNGGLGTISGSPVACLRATASKWTFGSTGATAK